MNETQLLSVGKGGTSVKFDREANKLIYNVYGKEYRVDIWAALFNNVNGIVGEIYYEDQL